MGAAKQATGGLSKLVRVGGSAGGVRPKHSRLGALREGRPPQALKTGCPTLLLHGGTLQGPQRWVLDCRGPKKLAHGLHTYHKPKPLPDHTLTRTPRDSSHLVRCDKLHGARLARSPTIRARAYRRAFRGETRSPDKKLTASQWLQAAKQEEGQMR